LTAFAAGAAAVGLPEAASAGLSASVPLPAARSGVPAGGGQRRELRHLASSASHSKPGPVLTFFARLT
jgi:hypothetical protein